MDVIIQSFNGVLTVSIIIAIGILLDRKGWFNEESVGLVSKLVAYVCLPTYMLTNMIANFRRDELLSMVGGLVVPFVSIFVGFFLSKLIGRLMGMEKSHRGIFTVAVSFSNVIFIGLPVCVSLFGDTCVPYIMLYYMANTVMFWTIGNHELAVGAGTEQPLLSKKSLKSLVSPPLMGFFFGLIFVMLQLGLPQPVFSAFRYVGSMTTPLAMVFTGIAMSKIDWHKITLGKEAIVAMLGRYLICPLIVFALAPMFNLDSMMAKVFVILAAMPMMSNGSIMTRFYGGDYQFAAMLASLSTALAIVVIPFYMWLVSQV